MARVPTSPVTQLLEDVRRGDADAAARLMPLVYADFHALAMRHLAQERKGHTLQPTALVHEAFGSRSTGRWKSRGTCARGWLRRTSRACCTWI